MKYLALLQMAYFGVIFVILAIDDLRSVRG